MRSHDARSGRSFETRARAADVARQVGVSISTVSLVVNEKWEGRVSPATAARVRRAIDTSGYVVDDSARRLATGDAGAVAIVVPAFTNPFYSRVAMGVASALGPTHQLLFPVPERDEDRMGALDRLLGMRLDGALVIAPTAAAVRRIRPELPVVELDAPQMEDDGNARVNLDVAGAAVLVADHLLDLGHQMVAFVGALPETPTLTLRGEVLRNRLRAGGATVVDVPGLASTIDPAPAADVVTRVWPHLAAAGVTAMVCATDLQAYGALHAAHQLGVDVPDRLSVAAFDDLAYSAFVPPGLTTASFPAHELGRVGAQILLDVMEARRRGDPWPSGEVRSLPSTLVVRGSTAPPSNA